MDEKTLLNHRHLWAEEKTQHSAEKLSNLNNSEQGLYLSLKQNQWGQNIRLEQERIFWDTAWDALRGSIRLGSNSKDRLDAKSSAPHRG
jgi:hypothetical protein